MLVKRKIFNNYPRTPSSWRSTPAGSPGTTFACGRRLRSCLQSRTVRFKKLFFNEYVPLNSYFAGGVYENPDNPKNPYDPQEALKLLADAGWKDRDAQGRLVKNGQPLQIELLYDDKGAEKWMTVYQDDLRKVGITLNLQARQPGNVLSSW